jgi:hypothetical protein
MSSAMALMKKMDVGTGEHGVLGLALDGAAGFGASYALGRVYHQYGDKWYGRNAPRLAAAVGKLGAVAISMLHGGEGSIVGGVVNSVGQAGLNAMGLELGLRHARKKTGKKAVLVPAATDLKKIAGASEITTMGALGRAAPGRGLSWDQIEELAAGR